MITLRLDAGHVKGMGHLFRMKILAEELARNAEETLFVVRENQVSQELLDEWGYNFLMLPDGLAEEKVPPFVKNKYPEIRLWIYDMLSTEPSWVLAAKSTGLKVVTIDDMGAGATYADEQINPIIGTWRDKPQGCKYEGPAYALLPSRLAELRNKRVIQSKSIVVGLTFGGSDTHGTTIKVLDKGLEYYGIKLLVFTGPHFQHMEQLKSLLKDNPTIKHRHNVQNLPGELAELDGIICSGGHTLFEAAALGLPILAIANEPHEQKTIEFFEKKEAAIYGGDVKHIDKAAINKFLSDMLEQNYILDAQGQGKKASSIVDGKGAQRVCHLLQKLII